MLLSESPPTPDLLSRLPVVGPVSRAVGQDTNLIFYLMVIALTVLVLAVKGWGVGALTMAALAFVPCMFVFFIAVTWP